MIKTAEQLIANPQNLRPHIILLGAGASRAAFPNGDAMGRHLPLMDDLVDVVGLRSLIDKIDGYADIKNFEILFEHIAANPALDPTRVVIEDRIDKYFSNLQLPHEATIYDRLLLSLRPIDAIFTFNWDPFLFDAYLRNCNALSLPEIFFLHGNVRIGACNYHDAWGDKRGSCPNCFRAFSTVPLLYPISEKNYFKNPYIKRAWESAKTLFTGAFMLTIFGYRAPESDKDAVDLLRIAWFGRSNRQLEHIEIIDVAPSSDLHNRWSAFTPTYHYEITSNFNESRMAQWPRRTQEALLFPMSKDIPCECFPLPKTDGIKELQEYARNIAKYEK